MTPPDDTTHPEPQQGLREQLRHLEVIVIMGDNKPYAVKVKQPENHVDAIMQLIEQTLNDCLPEKRDTGNPYGTTDGAISSSEAYGFNAAIDLTQANFKRRIAS